MSKQQKNRQSQDLVSDFQKYPTQMSCLNVLIPKNRKKHACDKKTYLPGKITATAPKSNDLRIIH